MGAAAENITTLVTITQAQGFSAYLGLPLPLLTSILQNLDFGNQNPYFVTQKCKNFGNPNWKCIHEAVIS